MNLSVRIFLGYFAIVGLAVWFVIRTFNTELVPGMRQSLEEVLVDTANLLAEIVREEVEKDSIADGAFARNMRAFTERRLTALIWFLKKRDPTLIVYITDANGRVIYDSRGRDVGADYSRWNDVYLTLQGQYGARTTREDPSDEFSSVMYVAAPIRSSGRTIGVLTVGKPSVTVYPFVRAARENIAQKGLWVLLFALLLGMLIAYWLTLSIRKLTAYARDVQAGKRVQAPSLRERELAHLADAMEAMRGELEGKHYVERYLHTLTHELKSPLAAIQGAAELLDEEMPAARRAGFNENIRSEARRLHQIVERLLSLAELEKRQQLDQIEWVPLASLVRQLGEDKRPLLTHKQLTIRCELPDEMAVEGERFLLQQAVNNLLDNAIDFSPSGGTIEVSATRNGDSYVLLFRDEGPGIPDYAVGRLFERFYSLPRPDTKRKSSGLGLSIVAEVAQLHHGSIRITNRPDGGAEAALSLPIRQPRQEG